MVLERMRHSGHNLHRGVELTIKAQGKYLESMQVLRAAQDWVTSSALHHLPDCLVPTGDRPRATPAPPLTPPPTRRFIPSLSSYKAVIRSCEDAGQFALAKRLLQEAWETVPCEDTTRTEVEASESYLRDLDTTLWRKFSKSRLQTLRARLLERTCSGRLDLAKADFDATAALEVALGKAADEGVMPSFEDPGARTGYVLSKVVARSSRVADFLWSTAMAFQERTRGSLSVDSSTSTINSTSTSEAVELLLFGKAQPASAPGTPCRLLSLGGGPGFDVVGTALLCEYLDLATSTCFSSKSPSPSLRVVDSVVLDYESGWYDCVDTLVDALITHPPVSQQQGEDVSSNRREEPIGCQHKASFGGCDITSSLWEPANSAVVDSISGEGAANLVVISYVVAENALALREKDYIFFRDLSHALRPGTTVLFTETTHRLWPEILRAVLLGADNSSLHGESTNSTYWNLEFPRITSKKGTAMALRKQGNRSFKMEPCQHPSTPVEWLEGAVERQCYGGERGVSDLIDMLRSFQLDADKHCDRLARQHSDTRATPEGQRLAIVRYAAEINERRANFAVATANDKAKTPTNDP
jgi:hypothetical protein